MTWSETRWVLLGSGRPVFNGSCIPNGEYPLSRSWDSGPGFDGSDAALLYAALSVEFLGGAIVPIENECKEVRSRIEDDDGARAESCQHRSGALSNHDI